MLDGLLWHEEMAWNLSKVSADDVPDLFTSPMFHKPYVPQSYVHKPYVQKPMFVASHAIQRTCLFQGDRELVDGGAAVEVELQA